MLETGRSEMGDIKLMVIVDLGPGIALGKEGNTVNKGGSPVPHLIGVSASL